MLKYLFILIYASISNNLQKTIRSSRTYALVSYLLSFWIVNILIILYDLTDLKYQVHSTSRILLCSIAICIFISVYLLSETYYKQAVQTQKSYRDQITEVETNTSLSSNEKEEQRQELLKQLDDAINDIYVQNKENPQ